MIQNENTEYLENMSDNAVETATSAAMPIAETTESGCTVGEQTFAEVAESSDIVYFEDLPLSEDVLDALYDMRFETCTPVQAGCIPKILEGKDMIGIAQTGTGKTAAYLLPILTLLAEEPHEADAVNCLIMAPTRELAQQIDQALQGFAYYTGINGVAVYGGNDARRYEQELRSFKRGADIVIATPGRLLSHLQLGNLDLSRTTHLILDEADRMLDMGFIDDIRTILRALPEKRQVILFSATMPDEITRLAHEFMQNPAEVRIAVSKPAEKIDQSIFVCREGDKTPIVKHIFADAAPERVILFASSKMRVKELTIILKRKGFNCAAMHSDLDQKERDEVMLAFRQRRIDMLIATDIVSRGIDIDDIQMVINYDCPRDPEDYVHRIGRTARAGKAGRAITLVGEKDLFPLRKIERLLEEKLPRNTLPEGCREPEEEAKGDRGHRGSGARGVKTDRGRNTRSEKGRSKIENTHRGENKTSGENMSRDPHKNKNLNKPKVDSKPQDNSKPQVEDVAKNKTHRRRPHHRKPNTPKTE